MSPWPPVWDNACPQNITRGTLYVSLLDGAHQTPISATGIADRGKAALQHIFQSLCRPDRDIER